MKTLQMLNLSNKRLFFRLISFSHKYICLFPDSSSISAVYSEIFHVAIINIHTLKRAFSQLPELFRCIQMINTVCLNNQNTRYNCTKKITLQRMYTNFRPVFLTCKT